MRTRLLITLLLVLSLAAAAGAREVEREIQSATAQFTAAKSSSNFTITPVVSYDFEGINGSLDKQGWTSRDLWVPEDTFFHVDDFAGLAGYAPLSGTQSLWCGTRATGDQCRYASPGYGNNWRQHFVSQPLGAAIPMSVEFDISYDTEAGYDFVYLDVDNGGGWTQVASFDGANTEKYSANIGVGPVAIRFRFESEGSWSDEDGLLDTQGACVIDSIVVRQGPTIVNVQDFEAEVPGAKITADGLWNATVPQAFGDFAELYRGTAIYQPVDVPNPTNLWAFFSGSPDLQTPACDSLMSGYPVVPFATGPESNQSIYNAIESPPFALPALSGAVPTLQLSFDVAGNMALDDLVFFVTRVQYQVGGCWQSWEESVVLFWVGPSKTRRVTWQSPIPPGTTDARVGIAVRDVCWIYCGTLGSGACHSSGPLIDNVDVSLLTESSLVVTEAIGNGFNTLAAAIETANTTPGFDVITFDLQGPGPHTLLPDTLLPYITDGVLIDGYSQPGASPNSNGPDQGSNAVIMVELNGSVAADARAGTFTIDDGIRVNNTTDSVVVRGLAVNEWENDGVWIQGTAPCRIEGCFIGVDMTGTTAVGNGVVGYGLRVEAPTVIGGSTTDCRNVISGNGQGAMRLEATSDGSVIAGNLIGTDAAGTTALPNGSGLTLWFAPNLRVGGETDAERNVIAGNTGIGLNVRTGNNMEFLNNYVGVDITGENPMGNTIGMWLTFTNASDLVKVGRVDHTGGSTSTVSYGNVFAHNTSTSGGVRIDGFTVPPANLSFEGNRVYDNLGQDLRITPDLLTPPTIDLITNGPNPQITLTYSGGSSGEEVRFGVFASESCDDNGVNRAQGQHFLFSHTATYPPTGDLTVTLPLDGGNAIPASKIGALVETEASGNAQGVSEFSDCADYFNTLSGAGVVVDLSEPDGTQESSVEFDNVTADGFTSVARNETGPAGVTPNFLLLGDYFDITTSATFTDSITVYLDYDPGSLPGPESDVRIYHYDEGIMDWVDATVMVDEANDRVCGRVASLSPFVAAYPNVLVGVGDTPAQKQFALHQNVPNPFNPVTTIRYELKSAGNATLVIFDVRGKRIRTLADRPHTAGRHEVTWNGRDDQGRAVSSGVYFYRLLAGRERETRKLVLLK